MDHANISAEFAVVKADYVPLLGIGSDVDNVCSVSEEIVKIVGQGKSLADGIGKLKETFALNDNTRVPIAQPKGSVQVAKQVRRKGHNREGGWTFSFGVAASYSPKEKW